MTPGALTRRTTLAALTALALPATRAFARQDDGAFPFELHREKMFFAASLNGVPGQAILDTGVTTTLVDTAFAARIGLPQGRLEAINGWAGELPARRVRGVEIAVGDLTLKNTTVLVVDAARLAGLIGRPCEIFLGRDVMDACVADIDFEQRRLALRDPRAFTPVEGAREVPLQRSGRLLAVDIGLEAAAPVSAMIDLGAVRPLTLTRPLAEKAGLLSGRRTSTGFSIGLDGPRAMDMVSVETLSLGGFALPAAPVAIAQSLTFPAYVGLPVFARFRTALDYGRRRLWLAPGPDLSSPFPKDRLGLWPERDGELYRVLHVSTGSPAETAGFVTGERFFGLVFADPGPDPASRRDAPGVGAVFTARMADDTVRTLTAAEYF